MNTKRKIFSALSENKELRFFAVFFVSFIFKYLIYGFRYFPVLDDYIQYGGYPLYNDPSYVFFHIGTISSRPLASFLDIFLWGSLWNTHHLMLILSAAFHFLSGVIFYKTAKENSIVLSPLFAVFYLFFPLGYEGSYWISASSRIVVGLFFCALALLALTKYEKSGKLRFFASFFVCALCAFTLYEACAVFCFMAGTIILLINKNKKRSVLPFITLCLLLFLLLFYMKLTQNIGMMGSRASESSLFAIFSQTDDFFSQLFRIMTKEIFSVTVRGFASGLSLLFSKGILGILYIAAVFMLCIITGRLTAGTEIKKHGKKMLVLQLTCGIVLFFAPFAPNMVSSPVWITYRTMFIPFVGLYLILDVLFSKIPRKSVQTVILTSLMFIFIISGINEYDTYKRTSELDGALVKKICALLPDDVKEGKRDAVVLLESVPEVPQVSFYKDHVKNVFHAEWSLRGAVRAELKNVKIKKVTPVYPDMTFDYSDCFIIDLRNTK